jgi:drug/metabolite transporter (DMT)-like permease
MHPAQTVLLLFALLSLGASAPAIRFAAALPLAVVAWRVALAFPVLALVSALRRDRWPIRQAAPAGIFLAAHWVCWVIAVQRTTIASAALLICTGALWSALLSRPLLGEPVSRRQWTGLTLALLGVAAVVTNEQGGQHSIAGDLYALGGSLAWVAYTFIGRRARQSAGFWGYTATLYLTAGLIVTALAVGRAVPLLGFSPTTWVALVVLALFPTLLGHGTWNYLLRFIGPVTLSLWALSEPVLATLAGWALFGETPGIRVLLGGVATLAGVALGVSGQPADRLGPP